MKLYVTVSFSFWAVVEVPVAREHAGGRRRGRGRHGGAPAETDGGAARLAHRRATAPTAGQREAVSVGYARTELFVRQDRRILSLARV